MRRLWLFTLAVLSFSIASPVAHAQLRQGDLRLALDADVFSVGWTKLVPDDGSPPRKQTTVGVGPNQFGASEVALPSAPLGFGVGYVLRPKWLLGGRLGFGYDHTSSSDTMPATSYLTWTFMPGVTYVPFGDQLKYFVNFSPLLDFTRRKQGDVQQVRFGGCFSLGLGTMFMLTESTTLDTGLYFEGRFPDMDEKPKAKTEISDLRWLLRVGLSVWK